MRERNTAKARRRAFWRSKIRFTGARLARFHSLSLKNIASRLSRWFRAWILCASMMLPIWKRNSDDSVCAIVVEPIQGEGGIFPVSEDFLDARARTCHAARRRAHRRRNSVRARPHGPSVRLPEISRRCQTSSCSRSHWQAACRSARFSQAKNLRRHSLQGCTAPPLAAGRLSAPSRLNF